MHLVRNVNSTYNEINRNFEILEKEGIVNDQFIGRMRIIRINMENPKTKKLLEALKILDSENCLIILS